MEKKSLIKSLIIRIDEKDHDNLKEEAYLTRKSMNHIVAELIKEHQEKK